MKFRSFIALVLMLSIIISTNGFSTLSAQKISDENNFYDSIFSPKKQAEVGDYYELLNKKQNLLMNTQNDIEESVEGNTEDENINTDELNNSREEEATEEVSEEEAAETNEEVVESNEEISAEPIEETTVEANSETTSESSVETGVCEEQIASESETEEELEISKKNDSLNFGADPHSHKVCGINASVDCTHTLDGITHTENIEYEPVNITDYSSFINYVNANENAYYYLTDHVNLKNDLDDINKDIYICLNGYNFYVEQLYTDKSYKFVFTNCKTESKVCFNSLNSNTANNNVYVYGVNKNIKFDNSISESCDSLIRVKTLSQHFYYSVKVDYSLKNQNSDLIKIIYNGIYRTSFSLKFEDVDFKMRSVGNYKYIFLNSDVYANYNIEYDFKNITIDVTDAKMNAFIYMNNDGMTSHIDNLLSRNRVKFYGNNTINGWTLDSSDDSKLHFIQNCPIYFIDGETTFQNIRNNTGGSIMKNCDIIVEEGATFNFHSNYIKYKMNEDQFFISLRSLNLDGSFVADNNSFNLAGNRDNCIRTLLYHVNLDRGYGRYPIYISANEKIVFQNTKIYKSEDDSGEELGGDLYIYDIYTDYTHTYAYITFRFERGNKFNKDNCFGVIGLKSIDVDTTTFDMVLVDGWDHSSTDVEDLDSFNKYFKVGKQKADVTYIHRLEKTIHISMHSKHKLCGAIDNCTHTIATDHTNNINYELLDLNISPTQFKDKIESGTRVKYLYLRSNIVSESILEITLKNDLYLCLNGHSIENVTFATNLTQLNPTIIWNRFNLYISNCYQVKYPGCIKSKNYFTKQVKLNIFGVTSPIEMSIESLCLLEATTKINNTSVSGLLTGIIDFNLYKVALSQVEGDSNADKYLFNNLDRNGSGEYQDVSLNIEETSVKGFDLKSMFTRNIYLKNKNVDFNALNLSGDLFGISKNGAIDFVEGNNNYIRNINSSNSELIKTEVPFTVNSGLLTITDNNLLSSNAVSLLEFNNNVNIKDGASFKFTNSNITLNNKNQSFVKILDKWDYNIEGNFSISNNNVFNALETNNNIFSTLYMSDKAKIKFGSGEINISDNKAYKNAEKSDSELSELHICQIYTEMKNYDTPIFELAEGATLNTNCKFDGIHFKYNGGSGHILNNFNYDESIHQNIFVLDKHGNDNLNLYQDGDDLTVRGKLYTVRYNFNNPAGDTFTQVSTSSVPTKMISNNTTKPDHIFIGWATVSDLIPKSPSDYVDFKENSVQFVREFDVDGQVVDLYGVWFNLNTKFNVSFDMHGHGTKIATMSIPYNSLIDDEPKPTAIGYIFDAWYKEAEYEKLWNFEEDKVDNDLILHAKWDPKKYNFTLVLDNGAEYADSYTSPTSRKYDEEFQFPTDANVVKKGYKVYSWHENQDFSDTGFTKIPKYTDTVDNKTYYLKMGPIGYRVTFRSSDSNVIGTKKSIDCIYDNPTTYKAINISEFKKPNWKNQYYRYVETRNISDNSKNDTVKPNRTRLYSEYEFNNLSEVDDVEFIYEPIFTMISNEETDPGKSREEHEEQTKDNETFIITYYMNRDDSDTVTKIETYDYNKIARIKSAQELGFINEGYKLIGFSIEYDKTAKKYDVGEEIFFEADASPESENNINLYALWDVIGYKVTFTADGISGVSAESVTHNLNFTEVKTSPAKDYFKKENENVAYYEFSHSLLYGSEYNYTAKRERIYTNAEFSKLATFEDVELVYKPHYTRESNASTDPELSPEEREEKTKQYETFNITYYANKSAADTENKIEEYRYDTVSKIKSDLFVNPGYHLLGWTDVRTSKNVVYSIDEEIFFKVENDAENDINLYAVWKENTYKVVWTADGLSDVTGSDIEKELRFTELCKSPDASHFTKVSKDNYRFAYYEYFKIEPSSSTGYNLLRQRLYSLQDFVKLVDINDVTLYFKPVFTSISNEETNPGHSTDEHSEQTRENETFVFTYMPNGADGNEKVVRYRYDKIAFAEKQIYQRTGYEFLGWDENENAAVATYEPGQELFMMVENDDTNDKTLYAIWLKFEYTVVFSANGQTDVLGTDVRLENIAYDEIKNAPPQNAFTRNSDKFAYYEYVSTTVNGEVSDIKPKRLRLYAEQEFKNLSAKNRAEYLFRAVFTDDGNETDREEKNKKLSFEIHYHANNGTNQKVIQIASYSTPTFIKNNNFKYDKYIFKGYSESKNNKNVKYKNGDEVFVKVEDNRIYNLYAVWEEDPNYFYQPTDSGGGNGGSGGGGGSFSMDPVIGVPGQQYAKYFVQNEEIYVISKNKSTGGDGNNGNKMNGKWYYEVETAKWKYITDPTDRLFNPQIKEYNGFLVDGMYMLGNNKYVYSFDPFGYLETGILYKNGKIYYAETSGNFIGALVKGEEEINGIVYNFNNYTAELMPPADNIYKVANGEPRFNPNTNSYHYFVKKDDGQEYMLTNGMYKIKSTDGKYYNYYFDIFGNIITGIVTYNNKQYYMGADGREVNNLEG